MNRAFKTDFHGDNPDRKNIVTMSLAVKHGKLFKALSQEEKVALVDCLVQFRAQVTDFTAQVIKSMSKSKSITNGK